MTNVRKAIGETFFGGAVLNIATQIMPFLKSKDRIIDLGAGTCLITKLLKDKGYDVQAVDIKNNSYYPEIKVRIYDGRYLPFKDNEFDACILKSVLHHTHNPEAVLREAVRVSKKLIIYENVVTNIFQRYYTYLIDCMMNRELIEPHTNKTDKEWRLLFKRLRLDLVKVMDERAWLFLQNKTYF